MSANPAAPKAYQSVSQAAACATTRNAEKGSGAQEVDRFALQTLCWRLKNGQLELARRADSLRAEDTDVDPQALLDYLFFHVIPSPRTIFKGIRRLPPAHSIHLENQQPAEQPTWTPQFTEPASADLSALITEFRALLRAAVSRELGNDEPACYLSGGTDSSTVSGIACLIAGRPAHTFSIGFDAEGYDEMAYARLAAKHFGCRHHEYYVTPQDLVRYIPSVAAAYDQPFGNSSALPAYCCALRARESGVTKLLAGDGGDELFGGNARYADQRFFDHYDRLPRWLRRGLLEPWLLSADKPRGLLLRKVASYVGQASAGMPARLGHHNLLWRIGPEKILTETFLSAVDLQSPQRWQQEVWDATPPCSSLNRHLAFDWRYTLAETDLPKVIGTADLAGIRVGFPMLDPALVDFSMRLPSHFKVRGKQLRWFFKQALSDFLPSEIITKKKQGFGLPFGPWVMRDAALRAFVRESLDSFGDRGVVRNDFLEALVKELLPVHPGYYGEMVWILLMLEHWMRAHAPNWRM